MVPCSLGSRHTPKPARTVKHHKIPLSWGGPNTVANQIDCCDNHHYAIHVVLDELVQRKGNPRGLVGRYGGTVTALALYAWNNRPNDNPPRTIGDM